MSKIQTTFKKYLHRLIFDMSSDEYHSTAGTFSSSQLKDLLGNIGHFVRKHIHKQVEKEQSDAFDVGTYFHTRILEPHKVATECVVYPGKTRYGSAWEKFKADNQGKAIVTESQKQQAEGLVRAIQESKLSQRYLKGKPEVSLFVELNIHQGKIYAPYFGKMLTPSGWVPGPNKRIEGSYQVFIKVRSDVLGDTFISDLKSTTGDAECEYAMADKVEYYNYDLSASLYLDIFWLLNPKLKEFWWLFASKDMYNARPHKADDKVILVGRAKYMYALKRMAEAAMNDWKQVESAGIIRPSVKQMRWLEEKETDLI